MEVTISSFLIGFNTAFFTIFAVHILVFRQKRTRFQTVIGIIMAIWGVMNIKDIILLFPGMYREDVLNWIIIIDGWMALTYLVFVFETTQPGWTTWRNLLPKMLPFGLFTAAFAVWPNQRVIIAYEFFLWFFAWAVVILGYIRYREYLKYVHDNYSNLENIDVSWLKPVFFFAIVSQLLWLFTSINSMIWTDIIYYLSTISLWLAVLYYTWNFHPIEVETYETATATSEKDCPFPVMLEEVVEQQQLYLQADFNINDLCKAVGSNRSYVSSYLNKVIGLTFYDYINRLRIERQSIPMILNYPEYTIEHVAHKSGFSSISTFRRAFVKFAGVTPSQFKAKHSK